MSSPPKIINSVARASDILRCLSDGTDRIVDISNKLQLGKSTIHRLLKTLEKTGLVIQDPLTRRYCLGHLILRLTSNPMITHQTLVICCREEMQHLRDLTGETVGLQIRKGPERIVLEEVQSLHQFRFFGGKGLAAPINTGAAGKVLLSELEYNDLIILLKNLHLDPVAPKTITDKKLLIREIDKVRRQGHATSLDENTVGGAAIAVPIKGYICPVALGVIGPKNRFLRKRTAVLPDLKRSADRISGKLKEALDGKGSQVIKVTKVTKVV